MGYNTLIGLFEVHLKEDATLDGLDKYLDSVVDLLKAEMVDVHEVAQAWEVIYTIINSSEEQVGRQANALRARMGYIRYAVDHGGLDESRSTERHGSKPAAGDAALD